MEHYWCLRWLLQERVTERRASVIRDTLVRSIGCRWSCACRILPALPPETGVRIAIGRIDLLADTLDCRTQEKWTLTRGSGPGLSRQPHIRALAPMGAGASEMDPACARL
jgi:hypothetical protein